MAVRTRIEFRVTRGGCSSLKAVAGITLEVVKLPKAKKGFVLLPRRWVVERSFTWAARFRRLARDYERLAETLTGLHYVVFTLCGVCPMWCLPC